jgi:hypothetical protein
MPLRIRRPEYTGGNRCRPCTALNAAVVIAASVLVGVVSPPAGIALCLGGAALVALRGYAVPDTPRLVSALPFDVGADHDDGPVLRTDGGRERGSLAGAEPIDGEALIRRLVDAGVVTTDDAGDVHLDGDVRRTWEAGIDRLRDVADADLAAAAASAAPFPAEGRVEGEDDWIVVERTESDDVDAEAEAGDRDAIPGRVGDEVWLSRAHAVADTAAVAAMSGRVDGVTAARASTPFRLFLERCPRCGGTVEGTTAKRSAGGAPGVDDTPGTPVLACVDCGETVYES